MRQSLYIIIATALIKADINNELRKSRKLQRVQCYPDLNLSVNLLRDIGLSPDGFDVGEKFPPAIKATRTVRYLRHIHHFKIST